MTDDANITGTNVTTPTASAQNFRYGSHFDAPGWVAPDTLTLIAGEGDLAAGPYGAFDHVGTSGLDVTIDTGEAMVSGSIIARDDQTTITLPESTAGITVQAGYHPDSIDSVQVDVSGNFASGTKTIDLWEFDTNSTDVTATTNLRTLGPVISVENSRYETDDGSGTTVDNTDALGGVGAANYARTDINESFDGAVDINGQLAIDQENSHIELQETDTSQIYRIGGSNEHLNLFDPDGPGIIRIRGSDGLVETKDGLIVTSGSTAYEIQKDGTDGSGIINFKTT